MPSRTVASTKPSSSAGGIGCPGARRGPLLGASGTATSSEEVAGAFGACASTAAAKTSFPATNATVSTLRPSNFDGCIFGHLGTARSLADAVTGTARGQAAEDARVSVRAPPRARGCRRARHRRACEVAGVGERIDAPALLDDGIDVRARQREHSLVDEFFGDLLVAQRPMHVAERLLDELRQRLA